MTDMISKGQIRELSQKFAIDEFSVIREYLQVLFLSALYDQKESSKIYFKGGTALRLLLNSFRFSEDLDFTSLREKPLTEKDAVLETLFPVSPYPVVKCLSWEEVLAEKIRALMHRAKGRDLFDIWYLLSKGTEIDWEMADKKMAFYKKKVSREDVLSKISSFDRKMLKLDLGKFLPLNQRTIAAHIKEMLMEKLK